MKKFDAEQIRAFLTALDKQLDKRLDFILIGGSAAALAYGVQRTTCDVDTWSEWVRDFDEEISRTRAVSGLPIPVEYAVVADAPYEFESRLEKMDIAGLGKLTILVPEKHDLVLMKMIRGYEHDIETAVEIHSKHGLDFEMLITRYISEMGHVIGDKRKRDLNFLALIERLYDDERLKEARRRLPGKP
ncbi:MAG: DUF6036 family nucleotidyltransferase [Pseudomonadota bacterium]